jgi:hypothetical protein
VSNANKKTTAFNLKDWLKTYWFYVIIYVFFLYVSSTAPRLGDDWEVSQWYRDGIISTLAGMIYLTTFVNGRVASFFFGSFFAHYDFLWQFTAPLVFTGFIYLSARLLGYAHRFIPVTMSLLMLLVISNDIRIETYVWLVGNVGYIFVIPLILLYLNIIYNENTERRLHFWQNERLNYLPVMLLAFLIGLWVETVTLGFTAANILLALFSYKKSRKVSPYIRSGIVGCILSSLVLFFTPGRLEAADEIGIGIRQQIIQNVPGIMKMLVIDNLAVYLLFFIVFIAATMAGEFSSKGRFSRLAGIALASSFAIVIFIRMVLQFILTKWYLPVGNAINSLNNTFFAVTKPFPLMFCFGILLFVLAAVLFSPQREKLLVLYSIALVSAGVMVIAPYLGARIFSLPIFMLVGITAYLSSTIKINSIDMHKAALLVLIVATLLQMEKYYYYGEDLKHIETIRLQLIESYRAKVSNGLITKEELLVLPAYKADTVFVSANPGPDDFHMVPFKRYYHLPLDTKVIFDDGFTLKAFTITHVEGLQYQLKAIPLYDERYLYTFHIRQKDELIYTSPTSADNFIYYDFPGEGTYVVSCILQLPSGHQKEVYADEPVEINRK